MRRGRLVVFQLLLLTLCFFSCNEKKQGNSETNSSSEVVNNNNVDKPNVLFVTIDDLTETAVSAYNPEGAKTPNIDALAADGTIFKNAYCQFPVCGPSRASFMFGYYPHATTTFGYISGRKNVGDRQSIAEVFKDNGYYTARVSKIFHMGIPGEIEAGTSKNDDPQSWDYTYNCKAPEWQLEGDAELVQNNPDGSIERKGGNKMTIVKGTGADLDNADKQAAVKACELITENKDKPFFLALGLVRPHVPWVAPSRYFNDYNYNNIELPKKVSGDWDDIPAKGINYVTTKNAEMTVEQQKKAVAAYYSTVAFMDDMLGDVIQHLKDEGLYDNTIIVVASDHGFHLGEHDFWMKVSLHNESVRVPFIIRAPGKAPVVCNSLVELLDIYPTLAELAGLPYSKHVQGKSLMPTFTDANADIHDYVFSVSLNGTSFLIQDENWAYIQYAEDGSGGAELYDMNADPKQYTNLVDNPDYASVLAEYKQKLKDKLAEVRNNDLGITY